MIFPVARIQWKRISLRNLIKETVIFLAVSPIILLPFIVGGWLLIGAVDGLVDVSHKSGTSYGARVMQWSPTYQAVIHVAPYFSGVYKWLTEPRP